MQHNILYLLVPFFLFISCEKERAKETQVQPRPVQTVKVEVLGTIDKSYTGVVEPTEFSTLAFKIPGTLISLNVADGQFISQGYIIAQINPYDYRLKYHTALANYQTTKSIYERTQRLFDQNATATQDLEVARANYIQATSAVNIAKSTLEYTELKAPFAGLIEKKYVENFQEVQSGETIVRLVNPDKIEVRFTLPETNISMLDMPKTIYVQFDTRKNQWFQADIKEYIYHSDGSGIPVTLRISDSAFEPFRREIYPGFSCKVLVKIQNTITNNFIIPASAVFSENNNYYIWVVNPVTRTVHRQKVISLQFEDQSLIKEGLNKDDIIVTAGVADLKEGQRIVLNNSIK